MSTRRARIKAVASLPVRRKNAENQIKDEKPIKSPRTPRPQTLQEDISKIKSPVNKTASPLVPQDQYKTADASKPAESLLSPSPKNLASREIIRTPKCSEKVPVITSISKQIASNTFASPLRWASPARKALPSPIRSSPQPRIPSIISEVQFERLDSPTSVQSNPDVIEKQKNFITNAVERVQKDQNNGIQKLETSEDYNPPSIPESITDDNGMDGIVPLQPTRTAPKPLDLLKNEIISENAQVLFDPIIPLPSPSKVRPKLRPAPRLAPHRRNSIQGSASESEDETRRALLNSGAPTPVPTRQRHDSHTSHSTMHSLPNREVSRIRNDSVCSGVSQLTAPPPASPLKERHVTKCHRQEMPRRSAAMRRRRDPVKRDALTMYDLIFYNPTTNPIVPDQDELKAKEANQKDEEERKKAPVEEEDPDDPPADAAPVPQIKLGPNGEIMLDEQSLVIKQTDSNRKLSSSVVREGAWGAGSGRYSRSARTADWSAAETVRFYRALAAVGTDFTLMAPLFPDRNRRDLKIKFKKEERLNGAQVDFALRSQTAWDAAGLAAAFATERAAAARRAAAERAQLQAARRAQTQRARAAAHARLRASRGAKALETVALPIPSSEPTTADDFIQRALSAKARKKRKTPDPATHPQNSPHLQNKNAPSKMPPLTNVARIDPSTTQVPPNIEAGSLVVLTVNDPKSPTKKMLQTYISRGAGQLTPVALPPNLLSSVMGYVKKGTPRSNVSTASSPLLSPASVASADSRTSGISANPSVIQVNPSPNKRQRHSSYTITQL